MGLTTERKVFVGLMAIAGASLIIDQTILSPGSASAASLDVQQISEMPNEPILAGIAKPISRSVSEVLNERLKNSQVILDGASGGMDLQHGVDFQQMFSPIIKPEPSPQPMSSPISEPMAVATNPEQQIPTNLPVLSAVMPTRSGMSGAILDATLYRIGEITPDGYRLVDVEQRQVLVEYKGHEFWLKLPAFKE